MANLKSAQPELHTIEPMPAPEITAAAPDPFDLENLRLPQNFSETAGVKKLLRTVPVRRPNKQDFVRVHPDESYRGNFAYSVFWRWSGAALDTAMSTNSLHTAFGWHVHVGENPNPRSIRNFPVQGNGAEMMRIAMCLATERGIEVCAPVHDAFLICAPLERLDEDIARMRQVMAEASRAVLDGFEIGTDVSITKFPDRFMDERGAVMWTRVLDLLEPEPRQLRATA
jgi:hypothetical protein